MDKQTQYSIVLGSIIELMKDELHGSFDQSTKTCIVEHLNYILSSADSVGLPPEEIGLADFDYEKEVSSI